MLEIVDRIAMWIQQWDILVVLLVGLIVGFAWGYHLANRRRVREWNQAVSYAEAARDWAKLENRYHGTR